MSRSNKVGLFGCSNLYGYHHAFGDAVLGADKLSCLNAYLDEHVYKSKPISQKVTHEGIDVENYSYPGCGNRYIYEMVKQNISHLDYCFIQFTGLTRIDIQGSIKEFPFQERGWVFSGGATGYWKQVEDARALFSSHYKEDINNIMTRNLQFVYDTISLIESNDVPYNWCFYYDTAKQSNSEHHQPVSIKTNSKFIQSDPHTYCYANGKGAEDGCHFMYDGYRDWLDSNKHQLNITL